ncbi:hypothetical protein OAJ35_01825 [Gammaproteobacteria bacterium]|nr:hypothetical protein [Gammaproteobacteria bacterium]
MIISLMLSQSIWSNFEIPVLTPDQLVQLTLDEDIRSENLIIQELTNEAMNQAFNQNIQKETMQVLVYQFLDDEIAEEKLLMTLRGYKKYMFNDLEVLEKKIAKLSPQTKSNQEFFKIIYKFSIQILTELVSHLREQNNFFLEIIDSVEKGKFESYDYLIGKSEIQNTNYLLIRSDYGLSVSRIMPNTLQGLYLESESHVLRAGAYGMKINALALIEELDAETTEKYYELIKKSLDNLDSDDYVERTSVFFTNYQQIIESINSEELSLIWNDLFNLYGKVFSTNLRLAECYKELAFLYFLNRYDEDPFFIDPEELDSLNERIDVNRKQSVKYTELFMQGLTNLQNEFLKLSNL